MGYSYWEFWEMNPRILEPILEGYRLKRKVIDEEQWLLGGYLFDAISIALSNLTKRRGQKAKEYFEILKNPKLESVQNKEMTEEEKEKQLEILVASLRVKQANFELSKGKKER